MFVEHHSLIVTVAMVAVVLGVLATVLQSGAQETSKLPNYRWVVTDQEVIVRPVDIGEQEGTSVHPEGLTFAENGDLLLAASIPGKRMVLLRSSDRGHTWSQQGILEYKDTDLGRGTVEGLIRLASGRLVVVYYRLAQDYHVDKAPQPADQYFIGGGHNLRFTGMRSAQWGVYSDDDGQTWHYVPMDISPFQSADFESSSQIFQAEDGTLVASFRGHLSQAELDSGITSNGVIRSHDEGLSWGDANPIHKAQPGSGLWYNESQVLPLADGRWLCMMRLNNNNFPSSPLTMCRSYSNDKGYTWSYPVRTRFHGGEPGMGWLADGAIMCAETGIGWVTTLRFTIDSTSGTHTSPVDRGAEQGEGLLYEVSYDQGRTWQYWGPLYASERGSREHMGSIIIRALDEDSAIAVYHRGSKNLAEKYGGYGPQFIGASWLEKVPADSPQAADLQYPEWLNQ